MLKFTYTDSGFNLERLAYSVEELVSRRVILAMRVGKSVLVEPSTAAFLLPADLCGLHCLEAESRRDDAIALCAADAEYVEISLRGTWISDDAESGEGVFVTAMSDRTEFLLLKLWQQAQSAASCVKEVGE